MKRNVSKHLALIIVFALCLSLITSCKPAVTTSPSSGASSASATVSGAQIVRGGTVTVAKTAKLVTLDVTQLSSFSDDGFIFFNIFDTLLKFDSKGNIIPALAKEWSVSADGKKITLKLRNDVKFSDGTPFNADACKTNLDFYLNPDSKFMWKTLWLSKVASIDKIDDYTVQINMSEPDATYLTSLSFSPGMMMSPAVIKDGSYKTKPVGSGPFVLKEWVPGDHVTIAKNPNYYVKGEDGLALPYLDEVIFKDMNDDNVKTTNLQSGTVDGVDYNSSINSLKTLQADKKLVTVERPYITTYMVTFNLKDPQLKDVRVRQAVSYAINQKEMLTSVFDGYAVETNFVGVGKASPYYSDYAPYSYNPEKAKALLKDAGYPNGITIKINSITREPDNTIVQVLQQQFKASGITLKVEPLERLAWIDVIRTKFSGEMGLCIADVPGYDLTTTYNQTLINSAPDSIAVYLPLLDKTKTATTTDGRKTAFAAFQKQILDDAVVSVLCQKGQYATYSAKVHGFKFFATCTGDYSQVWKEK